MLKQASKITTEKGFHSPISAIDESQRSSSMFVSLEEFQLTLHVLKRSLHFHFTANISKLFNVVIYRDITLCENIIEASEMTEKVSIRLFLFYDESHCTSSMFVSLITNAPKCTSR